MGYIPNQDAKFVLWAQVFANRIAELPSAYGLSPSDGATLVKAAESFRVAFAEASSPLTRTSGVVDHKNVTRARVTSLFRTYAQRIKHNKGITDQAKIDLGVVPLRTSLTKRRCPQTSPMLGFVAATPGQHTLRYADSLQPHTKRKPFGAHALQLFMTVCEYGEKPNLDPDEARYVGEYGRNPIEVDHAFKNAGKTAVYFARWVGARNEHGPWSLPLRVQILFAGSPRPLAKSPKKVASPNEESNLKLAA